MMPTTAPKNSDMDIMMSMSMMAECKEMMTACMQQMTSMNKPGYTSMLNDCMDKMMQVMAMMKDMRMMDQIMPVMEACMDTMMQCMGKMMTDMRSMMQAMPMENMPRMMEMRMGMMMQDKGMMNAMHMMQSMGMMMMDMEMMSKTMSMPQEGEMMKGMEMMQCMGKMNQMMLMLCQCMNQMKGMSMPMMMDMQMAQAGMNEITMAEMEMPGLMALRTEYGKTKPLMGMKMACSMHITVQTAVMMKTMMAMGAEVRCCACNMNTTQDDAAAAMNMMGIPTFGMKGMTMEEMMMGMDMCMFMDEAMTMPVNMLFDTTGMMTKRMMSKYPEMMEKMMGVCMDSVMGMQMMIKMMQQKMPMMPVMNMNTSPRKAKIDYRYGSMESLVGSIRSLTGMMIAGKVCVVAGYGDMGKACADAMKMAGARVIVTEIDPFCALQACMDGCMVMKMDDACQMADIIVTATENRDVIVDRHFRLMKNKCIVCNMSDYDSEIDMSWLNTNYGHTRKMMKPMVDMYSVEGRHIMILVDGSSVNMAVSYGYSSFLLSTCFTIQILAMMDFYMNHHRYEKKINKMPLGVGMQAATMHLNQLGIQLDMLTPEQEMCMKEMQMIMPAMMNN